MKEKNYVLEEQVGYLLRKVNQKHLAIFQEKIGKSKLTPVQFTVLCTVMKYKMCSQKKLVESTAIDQATIRGIVSRLINKELLLQEPDLQDKRKVMIKITNKGQQLIDDTLENAIHISDETLKPLNDAEKIAFIYLLKKLL